MYNDVHSLKLKLKIMFYQQLLGCWIQAVRKQFDWIWFEQRFRTPQASCLQCVGGDASH